MSIKISFKWYDFWVGGFYDVEKKTLYVCLIPCFPIEVQFLPTNPVRSPIKLAIMIILLSFMFTGALWFVWGDDILKVPYIVVFTIFLFSMVGNLAIQEVWRPK
jgi:hypothetical protein